jgi:hypothetical protein
MIELNLMPRDMRALDGRNKKSSFNLKIPDIPFAPVLIGIISVIVASQIIIGIISFIQKRQLAVVSKDIAEIAPEKVMAGMLKSEVDALNGKFNAIDELTQGSLAWSEKLSDLSNAMVDGIWLDSLSLNVECSPSTHQGYGAGSVTDQAPGSRQTLVLTGYAISSGKAEETATVGRFIDSLKKNEAFFRDFDDIKLSSIQRGSYGSADVMSFTIICYFKQDRSYFEKLQG